jgi:hypothetical protein
MRHFGAALANRIGSGNGQIVLTNDSRANYLFDNLFFLGGRLYGGALDDDCSLGTFVDDVPFQRRRW